MLSNEINEILARIANGQHTEADLATLRQSMSSSSRQSLVQLGKYGVNIGEGKDIHIGDRIFTDSGSTESIDWRKVSFERHLINLQQLFIKHLHQDIDTSPSEHSDRYVSLNLQGSQSESIENNIENATTQSGSWKELIQFPSTSLISGDSGSGKTTLLLHIAKELASKAADNQTALLPIYFSLARFGGGDANTLLAMAANASGQENRVIQALWREERQPLCFLLDGVDEIPTLQVQTFLDALDGLLSLAVAKHHTLILTSRLGSFQKKIKQDINHSLQELVVLPLDNEQIDDFLHRYSATALLDTLKVESNFQAIVRSPGALSAIAVSIETIQKLGLPQNSGQIYKLLVDHHLVKRSTNQYDYWRIKRPILAILAFTIFKQDQNDLIIDDALSDKIAEQLGLIYRRYDRNRVVMPSDWNVQALLKELSEGTILTIEDAPINRLRFKEKIYFEYFVAVYLEGLDVSSTNIQSVVEDIDAEKWINPLIFSIGLRKESLALFDIIFSSQTQQAADVWLEKRPYGTETPDCILSGLDAQINALVSSEPAKLSEPFTERLLIRLLNDNNPATRLRATCALSQWGLTYIDALLDAAEDSHPLVQAVAHYALLNVGESLLTNESQQSLLPLIVVEHDQLCFQSRGGCNAQIGPLHLVEVPKNIQAKLTVNIEKLDFDLFSEDASFEFWHTSPSWLAFSWFVANKTVDWLSLAARFQWIVQQSGRIAQQLSSRSLLPNLVTELQLRTAHYDAFGSYLASDLKLPWKASAFHEQVEHFKAEAEMNYKQLKYLFNRINRTRVLGLIASEDDKNIQTSMSVGRIKDYFLNSVEVRGFANLTKSSQKDLKNFRKLDISTSFEAVDNSKIAGLLIRRLDSDADILPPLVSLDVALNLEHTNESTIKGIFIEEITGTGGGLKCNLDVNIESFKESRLLGIVADNYPINTDNQGVKIPVKIKRSENETKPIESEFFLTNTTDIVERVERTDASS